MENPGANDLNSIRKETTRETAMITKTTFNVMGFDKDPEVFDETRYCMLKNVCQKLSRTKRSVDMINDLLSAIFVTKDAQACEGDHERQMVCILMKFKVCEDLAISCKLTMQQLLQHASHQIYG